MKVYRAKHLICFLDQSTEIRKKNSDLSEVHYWEFNQLEVVDRGLHIDYVLRDSKGILIGSFQRQKVAEEVMQFGQATILEYILEGAYPTIKFVRDDSLRPKRRSP